MTQIILPVSLIHKQKRLPVPKSELGLQDTLASLEAGSIWSPIVERAVPTAATHRHMQILAWVEGQSLGTIATTSLCPVCPQLHPSHAALLCPTPVWAISQPFLSAPAASGPAADSGSTTQRMGFHPYRIYATSFCWWEWGFQVIPALKNVFLQGTFALFLQSNTICASAPKKGEKWGKKFSEDGLKHLRRKGAPSRVKMWIYSFQRKNTLQVIGLRKIPRS